NENRKLKMQNLKNENRKLKMQNLKEHAMFLQIISTFFWGVDGGVQFLELFTNYCNYLMHFVKIFFTNYSTYLMHFRYCKLIYLCLSHPCFSRELMFLKEMRISPLF
ncbi:hypothetical protein ACJX0J_016117, partial [Zea mays]